MTQNKYNEIACAMYCDVGKLLYTKKGWRIVYQIEVASTNIVMNIHDFIRNFS